VLTSPDRNENTICFALQVARQTPDHGGIAERDLNFVEREAADENL